MHSQLLDPSTCRGCPAPGRCIVPGHASAAFMLPYQAVLAMAPLPLQIMVGPRLLVDPTAAEEAAADRHALVAMDASRQLVAHMAVGGVFTAAELKDVLGLALAACEFYGDTIKETLRADVAAQPA